MMRGLLAVLVALTWACAAPAALMPHGGGGAAAPTPPAPSCPTATVCSQIHNAPGWLTSHTYVPSATQPYTRVVNGAAWNGTTYTPGQTLNAYQLTSATTCVSASSGGPTGTASAIADGTCIWKYLGGVDYISYSGWVYDGPQWTAGAYGKIATVTNGSPLRSYTQTTDNGCTSTIAPTGTGTVTPGDGCVWTYNADVTYSSRASYIPTISLPGTPGHYTPTFNLASDYEAQLWNDQEYVAGVNGETHPMTTGNIHNSTNAAGDATFSCLNGTCHFLIITAAPGESFADNLKSSAPLIGYNVANGVGMRGTTGGTFGSHQGFKAQDWWLKISRMQFKGANGDTDNSAAAFDGSWTSGNSTGGGIINDNIFDQGTTTSTGNPNFNYDTRLSFSNNFMIIRGIVGFLTKYDSTGNHNTFICVGALPNSTAIVTYWNNYGAGGTTVQSSSIFGCAHAVAYNAAGLGTQPMFLSDSLNNVTDVSGSDSGTTFSGPGATFTSLPLPGGTYNLSEASVFVATDGSDWRYKSGSAAAGFGAAYGSWAWPISGTCPVASCASLATTINTDTPDMIGTARPGSTGTDPGSWQTP